MRCPVCTQGIPDDAPFCSFCGKVFDEDRTETERATMATGDGPIAPADPARVANQLAESAALFALGGFFLFGPLAIWGMVRGYNANVELEALGEPPSRYGTFAVGCGVLTILVWGSALAAFAALLLGLAR